MRRKQANLVASACRMIEEAVEPPKLEDLARSAGQSPFHFHRVFKAVTGLTPRAYWLAVRARRVHDEMTTAPTVTDAIYGAGYGSSSRFYEYAVSVLGMLPREYRAGGKSVVIHFAAGECSLGDVLVAATAKGVCSLDFGDDASVLVQRLQDRFPQAALIGGDEAFEALVARIVGAIEASHEPLNLPLDVQGTVFQRRVWDALQQIPVGRTSSYGELAASLGMPKAYRAVASACAANKIAVAIPCHRVIRNDGDLSGYRWGVERKRELLKRESL